MTAFHFPLTCTSYQFLLGSIFGLGWFAASGTRIDASRSTLLAVLPLAVVHTLGNLLTNVSLGMVAVSFTHTIKALEPLFSVLFSILFLGDTPNPIVLLTLLPIMGGVIGASLTEASFNWPGFVSAMMSNVTFQSRNVFSKKFMTPEIKEKVRSLSLPPDESVNSHSFPRLCAGTGLFNVLFRFLRELTPINVRVKFWLMARVGDVPAGC